MYLTSHLLLVFSSTGLILLAGNYYIHMLQLESYYISQFYRHLFAHIVHPKLLFASTAKKPLKYTARVIRLYIALAVIALAVNLSVGLFFAKKITALLSFPASALCVVSVLLTSVWVLLAALICSPIEKAIARWYVRDAAKMLAARPDLKIVGITGSYGKTSTKFILSAILGEKYAVLTPPSSYNTTMGVVRVIREQLQPDDQVFVCEMGARHLGDIKEICDFVHPHNGIITSIGPQHLETFGSLDNIRKGKSELIEALPDDGIAVFASGNEQLEKMYESAHCTKLTAGLEPENDVCAENISVDENGSAFTLVYGRERLECRTVLLGRHNISNILAAAAMALEMGLTPAQVAAGIAKLKPIEHRLCITAKYPVTIIDDAFNSSPNGAQAALEVLSGFKGRKIIVTPGFVELGKEQDEYHLKYGGQIKSTVDIAILVGKKQTEKILEGIGDFNGEVHTVDSLDEAVALLRTITAPGDVVLFENDLPDNY